MKKIFHSPTSIVFILMAGAVITLTFTGKIEPKDFVVLATMSFMHYFKRTNDDTKPNIQG